MGEKERYIRNIEAFTQEELARIRQKRVCIIGCGGLGGYVCHALARFGLGGLTVVDGDVFSESNLNRQLFATSQSLGKNKAEVAKYALAQVNPDVHVIAWPVMLSEENLMRILPGHDLAVDCLDAVLPRRSLGRGCAALNLPLVHGAIAGFFGQVATIFPGSDLLERLYPEQGERASGLDTKLGSPAFTPQFVAALQCGETIKILAGRGKILRDSVLFIDLLNNSFETVDFAVCPQPPF